MSLANTADSAAGDGDHRRQQAAGADAQRRDAPRDGAVEAAQPHLRRDDHEREQQQHASAGHGARRFLGRHSPQRR